MAVRGLGDQVETASNVIHAIEWAHKREVRGRCQAPGDQGE